MASHIGRRKFLATRFGDRVIGFDVTPDDRAIFPELRKRRTVRLLETDIGFVVEV